MSVNSNSMQASTSSWLLRLGLFAGLWWLLTENVWISWVIGIIVVPLAAWLSLSLFARQLPGADDSTAQQRLSLSGLLLFIPYFTLQSLRGGWDTARRVLHPQLDVDPGFREYTMQHLPPGPARALFMSIVSLLPGTVTVEGHHDNQLLIHMLSNDNFDEHALAICEQRVAALFALSNTAADSTADR